MKNLTASRFGGFTLIELLVVVLIIGILAAVALPQYQYVVLKSRYTEAIQLASSFYNAQQAYKMANGKYSWDLYSLDIEPPPGMTPAITASNGAVQGMCDHKKRVCLFVATGIPSSSDLNNRSPSFVAVSISQKDGTAIAYYKMDFNGRKYCAPHTGYSTFCQKITGSQETAGSWGAHQLYLFKE